MAWKFSAEYAIEDAKVTHDDDADASHYQSPEPGKTKSPLIVAPPLLTDFNHNDESFVSDEELLPFSDPENPDDEGSSEYGLASGFDTHDEMARIESAILLGLSSSVSEMEGTALPMDTHCASFRVDWDPQEFMKSEYRTNPPAIGEVITLSGSLSNAIATTCSDYLQATWPQGDNHFLSTLQDAVDAPDRAACSVPLDDYEPSSRQKGFRFKLDTKGVLLTIDGSPAEIVEVGQQIAWIATALRLSPFPDRVCFYRPVITRNTGPLSMQFTIEFESEQVPESQYAARSPCWLPLFRNAAIAKDFPVPQRGGEIGLEITLPTMVALVEASHAFEYEGGIVIKGFSAMFVPVRRRGSIVQWHLISNEDPAKHLAYNAVLNRCPDRALLKDLDFRSLFTTRAIVGWWGSTELLLAGESADHAALHYSGAQKSSGDLLEIDCVNIGIQNIQNFGFAQLAFSLGRKDGRSYC